MKVTGFCYAYPKGKVVKVDDFTLPQGSAIALKGANGSGKTTLLRALAGFLPADCTIIDRHRHYRTLKERRDFAREHMSLLHQKPFFFRGSVQSNLDLVADAASIERALAFFGLEGLKDKPTDSLSHGQRKVVAFVRAVLQDRPLLLLDEPLAELDMHYADLVLRQCEILKDRGKALLIATHWDGVDFAWDGVVRMDHA